MIFEINPSYSESYSILYFTQIKTHFEFKRVTLQTKKFALTVSVLPYKLAIALREMIISTPDRKFFEVEERIDWGESQLHTGENCHSC